jgi:hypothetical protein
VSAGELGHVFPRSRCVHSVCNWISRARFFMSHARSCRSCACAPRGPRAVDCAVQVQKIAGCRTRQQQVLERPMTWADGVAEYRPT